MDNYDSYIYSSGTHFISNCGSNEYGTTTGGQKGDQTGNEWVLKPWYSRPWDCVLRYPDQNVALKIAELACAAALNDNIGYDQTYRDTFWEELQKVNYDPSKITTPCSADCSSGVIAIVKAVGYLMGIAALQKLSATYTGDMKAGFKAAGFEVLTDSKYTAQSSYLLPGDIDLNESHHTATNVTVGSNATFNPDGSTDSETTGETGGEMTTTAEPDKIWAFLYEKIGNAFGTAGLMGNLYAESKLIPINLQDSYESKLGYTDESYTKAVDAGTYTKFTSDSAGYGLAQWTFSTRKAALKAYCDSLKASIGNLDAQLGFMWQELQDDFSSLVSTLKSATSVKAASDAVLTKYEQPADQGTSVQNTRASYGQSYYDTYAGGSTSDGTTDGGTKTIDELAQEVIAGKWGNGDERKAALKAAGYDYDAVQARVNELMAADSGTSSNTDENGVVYANSHEDGYGSGKAYKVTASIGLNMRYGPSSEKVNGKDKYAVLKAIPYGTVVYYYGYYDKDSAGDKWKLVISGGITGWVNSKYLA